MSIAHKIKEKSRTGDVLISEQVDFSSLLLSDAVIRGLLNSGFERPSPIQLKAIPLGRCGLDLIVQAKSGTGKTCVFAVVSLEFIQIHSSAVQVLVLAPTREIALQIWDVIKSIGSSMSGLSCCTFIGGMPVSEDKQKLRKCQIAIGTPGRIKQLIENGMMKTDSIRLFVLDEADKLLEESFQEQINWIYSSLPDNKQMLALSATYPESLAHHLTRYMRNPTFMRLNITDPALLGIRQYYKCVAYSPMANLAFEAKTKAVVEILSGVSFQQCLIFSNLQTRAQNLSEELQSRGWPTAYIAGSHDQKDRIEAMAKLKTYKCRVFISTDLTSRGIDADKVNLVINLDVPKDHETYLHRIGRAGRFGSYGAAITIASSGQEEIDLKSVEKKCNTHIIVLPDPLPLDLLKAVSPINLDDMVSTEQLITRPDDDGSCDMQAANHLIPSNRTEDSNGTLKVDRESLTNGRIELSSLHVDSGLVQGVGSRDGEMGEKSTSPPSPTKQQQQSTSLNSKEELVLSPKTDEDKFISNGEIGVPKELGIQKENDILNVTESLNFEKAGIAFTMKKDTKKCHGGHISSKGITPVDNCDRGSEFTKSDDGKKQDLIETSKIDAIDSKVDTSVAKDDSETTIDKLTLSVRDLEVQRDCVIAKSEIDSEKTSLRLSRKRKAKADDTRWKKHASNEQSNDAKAVEIKLEETADIRTNVDLTRPKAAGLSVSRTKSVGTLKSKPQTGEPRTTDSTTSKTCNRLKIKISQRSVMMKSDSPDLKLSDNFRITLPPFRETLGCKYFEKPHSYASALETYETFLSDGEKDGKTTLAILEEKVDMERRASANATLARQLRLCITRVYDRVISEERRRLLKPYEQPEAEDASETAGDLPGTDSDLGSLDYRPPCIQKCSKSTQTLSVNTRQYNDKPRSVRYHPMSVSSLALVSNSEEYIQKTESSRLHQNTGSSQLALNKDSYQLALIEDSYQLAMNVDTSQLAVKKDSSQLALSKDSRSTLNQDSSKIPGRNISSNRVQNQDNSSKAESSISSVPVSDLVNKLDNDILENCGDSRSYQEERLFSKHEKKFSSSKGQGKYTKVGHVDTADQIKSDCRQITEDISHRGPESNSTPQRCELMYVSDTMGKISLASDTVTVEAGLLDEITRRPKSRKVNMMSDLEGRAYGRKCGKQQREGYYNDDLESESSDSDSSSSSSDYEREVFRNNYVGESWMSQKGAYSNKGRQLKGTRRTKIEKDSPPEVVEFENAGFHEGYDASWEYSDVPGHYDEQDIYADSGYQEYYDNNNGQYLSGKYHHNPYPWGYYPPGNYFQPYQYYDPSWYQPQYYPTPYMYPPTYPPQPYSWGFVGGATSGGPEMAWNREMKSDKERIEEMKTNMELQQQYVERMSRRK